MVNYEWNIKKTNPNWIQDSNCGFSCCMCLIMVKSKFKDFRSVFRNISTHRGLTVAVFRHSRTHTTQFGGRYWGPGMPACFLGVPRSCTSLSHRLSSHGLSHLNGLDHAQRLHRGLSQLWLELPWRPLHGFEAWPPSLSLCLFLFAGWEKLNGEWASLGSRHLHADRLPDEPTVAALSRANHVCGQLHHTGPRWREKRRVHWNAANQRRPGWRLCWVIGQSSGELPGLKKGIGQQAGVAKAWHSDLASGWMTSQWARRS